MNKHNKLGFTLVELLVVITIIGILMILVTVTIGPIQKRSRDSRRKADVNLLLSGANQFFADFKVYPNYTMYLGNNAGNPNASYDLGGDLSQCAVSGANSQGMPSSYATDDTVNRTLATGTFTDPTFYNTLVLKPGFESVNKILFCLRYIDRVVNDSKFTAAQGYQYRVSYDYANIVVSATMENANDKDGVAYLFSNGFSYSPIRYFEGNGKTTRQLDDDSSTNGKFYILTGGPVDQIGIGDGYYLYQCWFDSQATPALISRENRVTTDFQPLIIPSGGTAYTHNDAAYPKGCQVTTQTYKNMAVQSY